VSRQELSRRPRGAAALEERAELLGLREQAGRTAAEAAQTLTELAGRLALAGQPGAAGRRLAVCARNAAARTLRRATGRIAGQRGAWRTVLAAISALAVAAAVAVLVARERAEPAMRRRVARQRGCVGGQH
jgi:hypothetical protein